MKINELKAEIVRNEMTLEEFADKAVFCNNKIQTIEKNIYNILIYIYVINCVS